MKKIKMTNNDYREYCKKNASRIWSDENYSYKDYIKDCDSVEILPFNLEKFNLTEELEKNINVYFDEDYTSKEGLYSLKGFSEYEETWYKITDKLNLKRVSGYYYNGYCYNEEHNFYMTYCEGDLYLYLFDNKEDYRKNLDEYINWFENEA